MTNEIQMRSATEGQSGYLLCPMHFFIISWSYLLLLEFFKLYRAFSIRPFTVILGEI